jgi:hypothetical protein
MYSECALFPRASTQPDRTPSHVDHGNSLVLGEGRLLDKPAQIVGIAGKQHDWSSHDQRRSSYHGVDSAPVTGQTRGTKQLASSPSKLRRDRQGHYPGQHAVHGCITRSAAKHLGQCDGTDNKSRPPNTRSLQIGTDARITRCQLGQTLTVQDQSPACRYSASGHAAPASAKYSSGTGPCSASSNSDNSTKRSSSNCLATASVT